MGRFVEAAGDRRDLGLCHDRRRALKSGLLLIAAALAVFAVAPSPAADEGAPLRICLNEELPPFSVRSKQGGAGFDVLAAQALAKRLGRPLAVQWYESKLDEDASSTIEANALLSDGRCDLFAGYPLVKDALGNPASKPRGCRILPARVRPIGAGGWRSAH